MSNKRIQYKKYDVFFSTNADVRVRRIPDGRIVAHAFNIFRNIRTGYISFKKLMIFSRSTLAPLKKEEMQETKKSFVSAIVRKIE
jgi:hypothetical protein